MGPEPAPARDDDGWLSAQPQEPAVGHSPNRLEKALLAAVRRGRNVAVVPPMPPVSPTPSRRSWFFNVEAMVPPGLDPVTARRGRRGRGQELAYAPGDDLHLRRPHTHLEAERWASTEDLDRDGETTPLLGVRFFLYIVF